MEAIPPVELIKRCRLRLHIKWLDCTSRSVRYMAELLGKNYPGRRSAGLTLPMPLRGVRMTPWQMGKEFGQRLKMKMPVI